MLSQLTENLNEMKSVQELFYELETKSTKYPETAEEVIDLIKMSRYQVDTFQFPKIHQSQLLAILNDCKQVLVETDSYYFV